MCIVGEASEAESGALKIVVVFFNVLLFHVATSVRVCVWPNIL